MEAEVKEENILGRENTTKLLFKFGVPGAIAMVVNSLYNIVDQIFIGQGVGYLGNAATNVVYPLSVFVLAVGALMGDGAAAYMSLKLGQKDEESAAKGAAFGIIGSIVAGVILAAIYIIFMKPLCVLLGGTEANLPYALTYGRIVAIGVPFVAFCGSLGSIIRADGKPKFSMAGLIMGCIINVILDPIFIFVFNWGVAGAAAATIIGQIANAILFAVYVLRGMNFVTLDKKAIKGSTHVCKETLRLGTSSFILQVAIVVAMAIQNKMIVVCGAKSAYGEDIPLAAVGVTMKVFSIVTAFVNGLSSGAQPIYGYNYGAIKYDRVKKTFRDVWIIATVMLCVAFALFQIFPAQIVSIFGSSDDMYNEFAVKCLKVFLFGLPITGLQLVSGTFFQSMGYPLQASLVSLSRQIIFMIPLLFLLTYFFGIEGFLRLGPIADVLSLILTATLLKVYWRKIMPHESTK
jgi:putative MATE family efflux protein